jgi:hypothetical protein
MVASSASLVGNGHDDKGTLARLGFCARANLRFSATVDAESEIFGANYSLARVNRLAIRSEILLTLLAKKRSHWRTRGGRGYGDMGDPNRTGRQSHSIFAFSTNKVSPFVS